MLMTRVTAWGIGRKNRLHEMCAAVRLLADDDFPTLSGSTAFIIRGQDVSLDEIRRYFRRKGCSDPVAYIRNLPEDQIAESFDVRLREKKFRDRVRSLNSSLNQPGTPEDDSDDAIPPASGTTVDVVTDVTEVGTHLQDELVFGRDSQVSSFDSPTVQNHDSLLLSTASYDLHLSIPSLCTKSDTLLLATQRYIDTYVVSIRQLSHYEPKAHYQTLHGRFSFQIQEGVACKQRNDVVSAITAHQQAFSLIDGIVLEDHPMSVTLILSLMCELLAGGDTNLVKHISKRVVYSNAKLRRQNHPVAALFEALSEIAHPSNHHLYSALRVASESFDHHVGHRDWRSMYLKERLCDALYYSQETSERIRKRSQLLQDQRIKYGPNARNVLFTQLNVADDHASVCEFDEAIAMFEEALTRAESLTDDHGFSRGRIRFAALEGKGNVLMTQAESGSTCQWSGIMVDTKLMEQAVECYGFAEAEANIWFEPSSKRSQRILKKKFEAEVKLHQAKNTLNMCQFGVAPSLSSWDLLSDADV